MTSPFNSEGFSGLPIRAENRDKKRNALPLLMGVFALLLLVAFCTPRIIEG